jgi:teichuronic acid exporter
VVTIYVMRILQPHDYGLQAMGGLITILASMLLDAGLSAAFVQRRDVTRPVYESANLAFLLSSLAAIVVIQFVAVPASRFFEEPELKAILRVSSLQFVIGAVGVVPYCQLTNKLMFRELAMGNAVSGVGASILTLALAMNGAGVWSLVFGVLAGSLIRTVMFLWYAGDFMGLSTHLSVLRSYMSFSLNVLGQRLAWFWVEQLDQLIIGKLLGAGPTGSYSVARNLSHIPLERTADIINQISLPSFAVVQDETARWQAALRKLVRIASVVAFPLFWGMAAVAPTAIPWLLGDSWQPTVIPFILFSLILPLRTVHSLSTTVLLALGRADLSLRGVLLWAALLSPMFLVGAKLDGINGVAAAWAIGFPLVYLIHAWLATRTLKVPAGLFIVPMLAPMAAAAACAGVATVLRLGLGTTLSAHVLFIAQVCGGAGTYLVLLRLLSREAYNEILDLVLRLVGRVREG